MVSIDPLAILIVSGFQRFEREVVGGPQIAPTRLVEGIHGNGIEGYGLSSGHMEAVVDVADHFFTRQQREPCAMSEAVGHGLQFFIV